MNSCVYVVTASNVDEERVVGVYNSRTDAELFCAEQNDISREHFTGDKYSVACFYIARKNNKSKPYYKAACVRYDESIRKYKAYKYLYSLVPFTEHFTYYHYMGRHSTGEISSARLPVSITATEEEIDSYVNKRIADVMENHALLTKPEV